MHKTIFFKVLWVGGARTSTVGLGVLLAVILGLAATTASPTPAGAVHGPPHPPSAASLTQRVAEDEALSSGGPPYTVEVDTLWQIRNNGPQNCKPGTLRQELWREVSGTGARPLEKIWESTEDREAYRVRHALRTANGEPFTAYWYVHLAKCENPSGTPVVGATYGVPFRLAVIEDPWVFFTYSGDWIQRASAHATGGTTHEARQVGATATVRYGGIAAAWVTTVDEKDYPIWARVMWDGCSWPACPSWIDTGSDPRGDARVVKWSSSWDGNSYNSAHTVQVISNEDRLVDVDAFVLVLGGRR